MVTRAKAKAASLKAARVTVLVTKNFKFESLLKKNPAAAKAAAGFLFGC
jgi:hypothetical protein